MLDSPGDESLVLPLPGALIASEQAHLPAEATGVVEALAAISPGAPARDTLAALEPFVHEARARWRAAAAMPARSSARHAEYDRYFQVQRIETSAPLAAYYEATIVAYHRLLREIVNEHSLTPLELGQLRAAFEGVLFRLRAPEHPVTVRCARPAMGPSGRPPAAPDGGLDAGSDAGSTGGSAEGSPGSAIAALGRWIGGHHGFFILIQALLLAHDRLGRAMRAGDAPRIQAMLDWAIELWWGAGAAFRLAGDFDRHAYTTIVRPSMCPPHVSEGFSGLHSPDHAELIGMLKATRSAIDDRCLTHPAEHRAYLWALSSVYDSHVYVCEEFVGDGPSLKGNASKYGPTATAVLGGPLKQRAMSSAGAPGLADEG